MNNDTNHLLTVPVGLSENELKEMISTNIICRLCANQSDKLIGIYSEDGTNNDLANKINLYLPVKVTETDNLPLQCCWQCASTVLAWHELILTTVEADKRLRSYHFVTERQLQEIASYKGSESILSTNTEESLKFQNKKFQNSSNIKPEEPKKNLLGKAQETIISAEEIKVMEVGRGDGGELLNKSTSKQKIILNYETYANFETNMCKICERIFKSQTLLKKHLCLIHSLKTPKIRRKKCDIKDLFHCIICNKSYSRKYDLEKHKAQHSLVKRSETKPKINETVAKCKLQTTKGETMYKCDLCDKMFKKSYSLTRHRSIHTNVKPHCCHLCGKRFRLNSNLIRHINEFHNNIRKFECTVCNKSFKNKNTRDEHMNIHSNLRPFVCDVCGKSFRQSSSLFVHKQFHSDDFPYSCKFCEKKFRRKYSLKEHSVVHTCHKPYRCEYCAVAFRHSHELKRHMKCHVTVYCEKCGSAFEQTRYLNLHRKECKQSLEVIEGRGDDSKRD